MDPSCGDTNRNTEIWSNLTWKLWQFLGSRTFLTCISGDALDSRTKDAVSVAKSNTPDHRVEMSCYVSEKTLTIINFEPVTGFVTVPINPFPSPRKNPFAPSSVVPFTVWVTILVKPPTSPVPRLYKHDNILLSQMLFTCSRRFRISCI